MSNIEKDIENEEIRTILKRAEKVRPLTEIDERECLARCAMEVPDDGRIVEIGCLYGGTTAVLALAKPTAEVITIDVYDWHPPDDVPTSPELLLQNMAGIGAINVHVHPIGDSLVAWKTWKLDIDFLFIDGGHSYEWVFNDLSHYSAFSKVMACHDYDNPFWPSIRKAVEDFLQKHPLWYLAEQAGTVAVLRRKSA